MVNLYVEIAAIFNMMENLALTLKISFLRFGVEYIIQKSVLNVKLTYKSQKSVTSCDVLIVITIFVGHVMQILEILINQIAKP